MECLFCGNRINPDKDRYEARQLNEDSRVLAAHDHCYGNYQMSKDDFEEFEQGKPVKAGE